MYVCMYVLHAYMDTYVHTFIHAYVCIMLHLCMSKDYKFSGNSLDCFHFQLAAQWKCNDMYVHNCMCWIFTNLLVYTVSMH